MILASSGHHCWLEAWFLANDSRNSAQHFWPIAIGLLAAVIAVKGTIEVIPDVILRDKFGDIQGIFQLGFAVLGLVVFGGIAKWVDGAMGIDVNRT